MPSTESQMSSDIVECVRSIHTLIHELSLCPQSASLTGGCMLMENCSLLLGADPVCIAGVRQVHAVF